MDKPISKTESNGFGTDSDLNKNNATENTVNAFPDKFHPEDIKEFCYSKKSHFDFFRKHNYDRLLYGGAFETVTNNILTYQNLLAFSFITQNLPEGSKILEIGSGDHIVCNHLKHRYECWQLEDPAELTKEMISGNESGFNFVNTLDGKILSEFPKAQFDFIFSVSAFDELPENNAELKIVMDNIDHLMKPGRYTLHCFSAHILFEKHIIFFGLLKFFLTKVSPLFYNIQIKFQLPEVKDFFSDKDLHHSVEFFKKAIEYKRDEYLNTASINYLWMKGYLELPNVTMSSIKDYSEKKPSYIYHHLMKCGGTSITMALQEWFWLEFDHIDTEDSKIELNHYLRNKLNLEYMNSESCIVSHFHFDGIFLHQRYPEALRPGSRFKIFTFVRDPFNIAVSLYYYERKRGGFKEISLKKCIESSKLNFLSKLIPCDESNYKEVLDRYFFIGIVERMQDSINKLSRLLNVKEIVIPITNTTNKDIQLEEIDEEYIKNYKEKNKLDYLIYDYCLDKFNKI